MNRILLLLCLAFALSHTAPAEGSPVRPRLVVLTDIGGDPDDQQSMVRLMVYANQFRIEGLIATASGTPGELKEAVTKPQLIREIVEAYGKVLPQLEKHEDSWPSAETLLATIRTGNPQRGRGFIGAGHGTDGSRHLVQRIDSGSPEDPLNVSIWGGQTDLAQALWQVRDERGPDGLADFVKRFRVFDIADQDAIGGWIRSEFPGLFYILSVAPEGKDRRQATFRGMYLTGDVSLTSQEWVVEHVVKSGPLGALYPLKTWTAPNPHGCLKEGDTPSWFFFLQAGGNDPDDPTKPGWGGRYREASPRFFTDIDGAEADPRETVSRWRPDFQADFSKRMAWCKGE